MLFKIFLILLPFPLFFDRTGVYRATDFNSVSFSLPLSLFIGSCLLLFHPANIRYFFVRSLFFFWLMASWWIFVFLLGAFLTGDTDPSLLLIYLLPMGIGVTSGSLFFSLFKEDRDEAFRLVRISFFVCAAAALLHVLSSFYSYGIIGAFALRGEFSIFGVFSIYQKFIYYPTILSVYFIIGLGILNVSHRKNKNIILFSLVIIFIDVLILAAREAALTVSVGLFLYFLINPSKGSLFLVMITVVLSVFFQDMLDVVGNSAIVNKILALQQNATAGRSEVAARVFSESLDQYNYLFGTFFSMSLGVLGTPHNQFLEILLRTGPVGLILLLTLVGIFSIKSFVKFSFLHQDKLLLFIFFAVCENLLIAFNVNTPIRAPFGSIPFYFYFTFLYRLVTESLPTENGYSKSKK